MTSSGTDGYTWDARNRLVSTLSGASFRYDAFGRCTSKTIGGTTTSFLYDGANAVQEVIGGTNTANSLMGGVDEVFQRTDSAGARTFLTDALGSTLALTDSAGNALAQYAYEPFGNTTVTSGSSSNEFQYTGRENDGTGLYFNRARYYSPTLQRFISEDPIGFYGGGTNLFAYAGNSPIDWVDPFGLDITIRWLAGQGGNPSGHIVVAVNDGPFVGFENIDGTDTKAALDVSVPGTVKEPGGGPNRQVWDTVSVHTTPDQDKQMLDYIRRLHDNPGNYKLTGRNCSMFANNVLGAAGINIPVSIKPKNFMHDIHTRCASHALNCAP